MRITTLLLVLMLLSLPGFSYAAKDSQDEKGLQMLLDMLGNMIGMAGDSVSGDSDMSEVGIDGDDNEVTRIDSLTININIGDVKIDKSGGGWPGFGGFGGRFREMLSGTRGAEHGGDHGEGHGNGREFKPDVAPPPMYHPGAGFMPHPPMLKMEGITPHPEHGMGHPGRPEGMELMHQRMELFSRIPPEVDAGFIEFIMHVGELAWEHPEFRERLEQMVQRMELSAWEHRGKE